MYKWLFFTFIIIFLSFQWILNISLKHNKIKVIYYFYFICLYLFYNILYLKINGLDDTPISLNALVVVLLITGTPLDIQYSAL